MRNSILRRSLHIGAVDGAELGQAVEVIVEGGVERALETEGFFLGAGAVMDTAAGAEGGGPCLGPLFLLS